MVIGALLTGLYIRVRFIDGRKKKMNPDKDSYNLGLTEFVDGVISIRTGMNRQTTRSTVIHELTHAFMFAFGYTVGGEEAMCDFFGAQGDAIIKLTNKIMERDGGQC